MYQVINAVDGAEHVLLDLRDEKYILASPKLTLQINGAGSFEFTIASTHPEAGSIKTLTSVIKVYRITGSVKKWIFSGRVMTDEKDIYNTGKVKCEGLLAYLVDSIVEPYEYQGTPADYVTQLINSHNSQMNKEKQFIIEALDLADTDSNNNIVRANENYPTTYEEMNNKVIELLGAYMSVEERENKIYFSCAQSINRYNHQAIRLGENIIDLKQTKAADSVKTVMIGLGSKDDEGNRISVRVENPAAMKLYGNIVGTVKFENVTTVEQLTRKTTAYLNSVLSEANTVEVKAVDLSMTDEELEEIELGYAYLESEYNGLDHVPMLINKMVLYLLQPDKNTFTLGGTKKSITQSLTHSESEIGAEVQEVAKNASRQIQAAVDNATQLITGAQGGYVVLDGDNEGHPERILIMDSPDKELARHVIQLNKNGIGFSTTGIDGEYANAWTIDGNLVASFITTGTMLADRIRGGSFIAGGVNDTADGGYEEGSIVILGEDGETIIGKWDKEGIKIFKGEIQGAAIIAGGVNNENGTIEVRDSEGNTKIRIDVNGIDVNDKFFVDMEGNMTAISIDGDAVDQISDIIDNSDAMKKAKQAISTAKSAADTAQASANTAQSAANTAQSAAEAAQTAADTANSAIAATNTVVNNLNNTIIPQINSWIKQMSTQLKNLGQPGIS